MPTHEKIMPTASPLAPQENSGHMRPAESKIGMFMPYVAESTVDRVGAVLRGRWVGQGALVDEFERALEKKLDLAHVAAVNSSSSAIRLALVLCGVRPGDEVITTPMTCTLTNHPILEQFARPVFADIQYETGNIDPADVARRIGPQTKAILCTHWGGQPADLEELNRIADRHGLPIIEDASEALGATYHGKSIGSSSRFTAFSFQAIQILTTGEGGALAMRDPALNQLARNLRWYGIDRDHRKPTILGYYDFDISSMGFGYHMTNIAAAIGLENMASLEEQKDHRARVVARYRQGLQGVAGVTLLPEKSDRRSSNHFFTMHVERRDDFCRKLKGRNIEPSIVHYRNDAYSVFGGLRADLPVLDRFSDSYIALPTHMHLNEENIARIISVIREGW